MAEYRHIANTRVAFDFEIKATLTQTSEGIAFDFSEEDDDEVIDAVEVPFSVLADMARQYLRGENWSFHHLYAQEDSDA